MIVCVSMQKHLYAYIYILFFHMWIMIVRRRMCKNSYIYEYIDYYVNKICIYKKIHINVHMYLNASSRV
jgi:hypothetical protein